MPDRGLAGEWKDQVDLALNREPRIEIGTWPTPVHEAPSMAERLGVESLWIKRDDQSCRRIGGTKIRKLEFLLAARPSCILTMGGTGSHHVLTTAVVGSTLGAETSAVLCRQPETDHAARIERRIRRACRDVRVVASWPALAAAVAAQKARRPGLLVIPPGGTNRTGILGCVAAGLELAEQVARGELPEPEWIAAAVGSAGTAAGLLAGTWAAGLKTRILAIRTSTRLTGNAWTIASLAASALRSLGVACPASALRGRVRVVHDQIGSGYGAPTPAADEAIRCAAECEGIALDPVYTGKAMAGLAADAPRLKGPILFWNTYAEAG